MREFVTRIGAEGRFFKEIDEEQANIAYVRIKRENAEDKVITMIANRWHDSVRTLFFENKRLNRENDSADFIKDYVGSYPNFLFVVDENDLGDFYDLMKNFDKDNTCDIARILRYGINRNNQRFWCHFDWFQKDFVKKNLHAGGLWDLNRYYKVALGGKAVEHYVDQCKIQHGITLGEFYNDHCEGPEQINSQYPYPELSYRGETSATLPLQ